MLKASPCNLAALANCITYNWEHGGGRKGCSGYISMAKAEAKCYSLGIIQNKSKIYIFLQFQ